VRGMPRRTARTVLTPEAVGPAAPVPPGKPEPSAALAESLVSAHSISLSLGGKTVLDQVSIAIHTSEIVTLIGPNGAGKTTLARVLLGLIAPTSGSVARRPGLRAGYVPQRFPIEQVIPLPVLRFLSLSEPISKACAQACLAETGAEHLIHVQMAELSGGEFQRVLLARALARNPAFLVLDEPAQAIDLLGAAKLYELIATIRAKRGCGILLISHDLQVVLGASDRVVCLNRHVCCEGVPEVVASHPEYARLFGPGAASSLGLYSHRHDHSHTLAGGIASGGHD
jgi:zinc transport system ATP-binding protein